VRLQLSHGCREISLNPLSVNANHQSTNHGTLTPSFNQEAKIAA